MELSWYIPNCHYGRDLGIFARGKPFETVAIDPETIAVTAREAEAIGFDTIWLGDHVMIPPVARTETPNNPAGTALRADAPIYDAFVVLGYLAAVTTTVKLGVGVIVIPYRNPVIQAKMLATIDAFSEGRVVAGCGTGWLKEEFDTLAVPFASRGALTDEYIDVMQALWTQEYPEYSGEHYSLDGQSPFWPKPTNGTIPIWIGGWSGRALRRAVRVGNGVLGAYEGPDESRTLRERLHQLLTEHGRDPATVPYAAQARFLVTDEPHPDDPPCVGSPAKIADSILRFKEAGMEELKLSPPPGPTRAAVHDQLRRFADDVMPRLHL